MISVCPECKRSYPTHHGPMCRLCAAKKNKESSETNVTAEQPKITRNTTTTTESPRSTSSTHNKNIINKQHISNSFSISVEGGADQMECPHCSYLNKVSDVFCSSCKKMMRTSVSAKNKDYKLSEIKNIASSQISQLKKQDIETSLQILERGLNPTKRKTLAMKTAIPETLLLRMVNQADLLRIPNIEAEQAYLLECIGVNSIKSLEKQVPDKLMDIITKNKSVLTSKTIYFLPEKKQVSQWIDDAKKIEKIVS